MSANPSGSCRKSVRRSNRLNGDSRRFMVALCLAAVSNRSNQTPFAQGDASYLAPRLCGAFPGVEPVQDGRIPICTEPPTEHLQLNRWFIFMEKGHGIAPEI
jgi:hypothetical protein